MTKLRNNHTASIGVNVKDEDGNVSVINLEPSKELDLSKHGLTVVETQMHKARVQSKLLSVSDGETSETKEEDPAAKKAREEAAALAAKAAQQRSSTDNKPADAVNKEAK